MLPEASSVNLIACSSSKPRRAVNQVAACNPCFGQRISEPQPEMEYKAAGDCHASRKAVCVVTGVR